MCSGWLFAATAAPPILTFRNLTQSYSKVRIVHSFLAVRIFDLRLHCLMLSVQREYRPNGMHPKQQDNTNTSICIQLLSAYIISRKTNIWNIGTETRFNRSIFPGKALNPCSNSLRRSIYDGHIHNHMWEPYSNIGHEVFYRKWVKRQPLNVCCRIFRRTKLYVHNFG